MKTFIRTLCSLIAIAIVALIVIAFIGWARVPDMLANSLSKKMKVSVDIDDINLSFKSIEVEKLEIGNPKKSILPKAFTADLITIEAPLTRYMHDDIVIDAITMDDIYIGLEFDSATSTKGNWSTIMANYQDSSPVAPEDSKRNVLIKRLILNNISVDLVYRKGDQKIRRLKPIKRLEFTNVSSQGGIPTDQIMNSVLGEMLRSIFQQENLKNMLDGILGPQKKLDQLIQPFQGLFNAEFDPTLPHPQDAYACNESP
jgi:uncharacterized protein involved in outer membrane biogenesis